jgi:hypothetical protein
MSVEANWEFVASLLIGHGIALQNRLGRTPTLDEFAASIGEALRRPLVMSTLITAAMIPFDRDPIALSLECWENTPHYRDRPYAIAPESEVYRIATEDSRRAGVGDPSPKGGHCRASIAFTLPRGPERDALRDQFDTQGVGLPDDNSVTVLAVFVSFGFDLTMETLFPHWPGVTVEQEPSLAEFRRLDAAGFARQLQVGAAVSSLEMDMSGVIGPDLLAGARTLPTKLDADALQGLRDE